MTSIRPGSKTWTIRFKLHKTTVLLYVEPTQKLSSIKTELLTALRETHPTLHIQGEGKMYQIPEHIDDVQLARMAELDDETISWDRIDADAEDEEQANRKGKGKAVNGTAAVRDSKETAQNVGLTDGSVVAVRFRGMMATEGNGHATGAAEDSEEEVWDVVLPSQEMVDGQPEEAIG